MNSLTKAITIALTTAALSSSVSADWWTGWDNIDIKNVTETQSKAPEAKIEANEPNEIIESSSGNWWASWGSKDIKTTQKLIETKVDAEKISAVEVQREAPKVKKEVAEANKKSKNSSGNWWASWGNKDTKNVQKLAETKVDTEKTNTVNIKTEAPEVKKEAVESNEKAKSSSGNWWTGWSNNDAGNTKTLVEAKVDTKKTNTVNIKTEAPEVKKEAVESNEKAKSSSGSWWTGWSDNNAGNTKTLVEAKVDAEKTNTVNVQSESLEVKKEAVEINSFSGNWWAGYNKKGNNSAVKKTTTTTSKHDDIPALFKQLMDKNPNIKISVAEKPVESKGQNSGSVIYKISGKAKKETVAKLVALIKNNETIEIVPMWQKPRGYNSQRPAFTRPSRTPYICYPAPMLVQPTR